MRSIREIDISGKKVFIRVDFNVPLNDDMEISDDTRIRAVLPTLEYASQQGARIIVASHLGRPQGKKVDRFSLFPVARHLERLLMMNIDMAPDCTGSEVQAMVDRMAAGGILLLENLRFHPGEQANDDLFAKALADLCNVYINDAFAVSHRANASVEAITRHVSTCGAGFLLTREIDYFKKAMADPRRPLVAVVGGAKVSSKLAALENLIQHVDTIIIGGAMANTFLKKMGCDVGLSRVEDEMLEKAGTVMAEAERRKTKIYLPVDAVVAGRLSPDAEGCNVPIQKIPTDKMVLDIGPATSELYDGVLQDAGTIIWNGPMGVFEIEAFSRGTLKMARSVADSPALSMVGGGDTDAAVHRSGRIDGIGYLSTGGGAFLTLLEGRPLPAVAALRQSED